jgi:hypothetical protein
MIAYLASDEAAFVTGQAIGADRGEPSPCREATPQQP